MAVEVVEPGGGDAGPDAGAGLPRRLLRPFVAAVLELAPGPELLTGLLGLAGRELSARECVEVTVAWKAMIAFCTAGQLTAVVDVDRALTPDPGAPARPGRICSVRAAADELAPALRIAPRAASHLVALARRADADLPAAVDAMADGRMDQAQLRVLDLVVRDLPAATRAKLEAAAVAWAPSRTAQQLRTDLDAEAARLDPGHTARAAARGVAERDVVLRASPLPGCRRLVADLPVLSATAAWLAVNGAAVAAKAAGTRPDGTVEDRGVGQLRADLLAALLTGQASTDPATEPAAATQVPTPQDLAVLAEVQVVVAADTLGRGAELPGHVPGIGPVDPTTARAVATRTRWRRLVADPVTGTLVHADLGVHPPPPAARAGPDPRLERLYTDPVHPARLDHGGKQYRPGRALRLHVHTRDATCIAPAHHHPARGTELDHTIDFGRRDRAGVLGVTADHNLGSACKRGHNAKTHGGWTLRQPTPGEFQWTSPTGRGYRRPAPPLLPGWRRPERQ